MTCPQIYKIAMLTQVLAMQEDKKPQDRPFVKRLIDTPDCEKLSPQDNEKLCKVYMDNIKIIRRLEFWQI